MRVTQANWQRSAVKPVSSENVVYGSDVCELIAKVLFEEVGITADLSPVLDQDGFPMNIDDREDVALTEPYWFVVWSARESDGRSMGTRPGYYSMKTYHIVVTGILKLDNDATTKYKEWGRQVEEVCNWLETHGTLYDNVKKSIPANITINEARVHPSRNFRYHISVIEMDVNVGVEVMRG